MRLVTALLVKNEANRYLKRVLTRCGEFSDDILVLDDGSTDDTVEVAKAAGCIVKQRVKTGAWGDETPARAELWERGAKLAKEGWLLVCDADMLLRGDPRNLALSWDVNAWCFILYDVWSEDETSYRCDGPWQAHLHPRPWLFRPSAVPSDWGQQWGQRNIHAGHFPPNFPLVLGVAPPDEYAYLHLAYCKPQDRLAKYNAYMEVKNHLSPFELAHAESILA